jgi:hypothetical protein
VRAHTLPGRVVTSWRPLAGANDRQGVGSGDGQHASINGIDGVRCNARGPRGPSVGRAVEPNGLACRVVLGGQDGQGVGSRPSFRGRGGVGVQGNPVWPT